MSDDSLMKKSIPTLLNAIEWPKESIPKLVSQLERFRASGPWIIKDDFLNKLCDQIIHRKRKKYDPAPIVLNMEEPDHRLMLQYLSLFSLPYMKSMEITNITEKYTEGNMNYLTRFVQHSLHHKQDHLFLNGINV